MKKGLGSQKGLKEIVSWLFFNVGFARGLMEA